MMVYGRPCAFTKASISCAALPHAPPEVHPLDSSFVFIHVPKCAGETVNALLGIPKDHRPAWRRRAECGAGAWNKWWKFCIVRNPWDRMVSWYFHLRKGLEPGLEGGTPIGPDLHRVLAEAVPFGEWVTAVLTDSRYAVPDWGPCCRQTEMVTHPSTKEMLVDTVFRFESRSTLPDILRHLGRHNQIPDIACINASMRTDTHYSQMYDRDTAALVGSYFASDCDMFGYRFESAGVERGTEGEEEAFQKYLSRALTEM